MKRKLAGRCRRVFLDTARREMRKSGAKVYFGRIEGGDLYGNYLKCSEREAEEAAAELARQFAETLRAGGFVAAEPPEVIVKPYTPSAAEPEYSLTVGWKAAMK